MKIYISILLAFSLGGAVATFAAQDAADEVRPVKDKKMVAYLGVASAPPNEAMQAQLGLSSGTGLLVYHVNPNGPSAGIIENHDVMIQLNDQQLVNLAQLSTLIRNAGPGNTVRIELVRSGKDMEVMVTLGEREASTNRSNHFFAPNVGHIPYPLPAGSEWTPEEKVEWNKALEKHLKEKEEGAEAKDAVEPKRATAEFRAPMRSGFFSLLRSATWAQDDYVLDLEQEKAGGRNLTVTRGGKVIFNGPVNSEEERNQVPREVQAKLRVLEAQLDRE